MPGTKAVSQNLPPPSLVARSDSESYFFGKGECHLGRWGQGLTRHTGTKKPLPRKQRVQRMSISSEAQPAPLVPGWSLFLPSSVTLQAEHCFVSLCYSSDPTVAQILQRPSDPVMGFCYSPLLASSYLLSPLSFGSIPTTPTTQHRQLTLP